VSRFEGLAVEGWALEEFGVVVSDLVPLVIVSVVV
jgi:hypothetical protein